MRSVNLVGAGFRDIVVAGMINYCEKQSILPDLAFAASGGGLAGIMWSLDRVDDMLELFLDIRNKNVRKFAPLRAFGKQAALYDFSPLEKTMRKLITPAELKNCRFPLYVAVTDMRARCVRRFNMRDLPDGVDPITVLVASASIPGLVPPVGAWVDGGVSDDYGLLEALKAHATDVVMMMPSQAKDWSQPKNVVDAINNAIQMLEYSNYSRQKDALQFLPRCLPTCAISDSLRLYLTQPDTEYPSVKLIEIAPPTDSVPSWDFSFNQAARAGLIRLGYDSAEAAFARI